MNGRAARAARAARSGPAAVEGAGGAPTPVPPGGDHGDRGRREGRPLRTLVAMALFAAVVLVAYAIWALAPIDPSDARVVEFEVPRGRSAAGVAEDLVAAGLTRDARVARAFLIATGADTRIGEGLYDVRRDQGFAAIRDRLVAGGRPRTARLLLPEGLRLDGVVARVVAAGWSEAVAADLAALLADPPDGLRPEGLPDGATLEGYLFPATYDLPVREGAAELARALVDRFERELSAVVRAELVAIDLAVHDWVTLASMVQAEAGGDDEMALIAGVFLN
ncbi:MAG: endolytic transglycosylase MltG, partial [Trueperaceae bacterium]